jgi:DNA-binding transcriptional LysR family regulator
MDLKQLRNLAAVLDAGSIGKAAAQLHISQPALSKSIRRLEEELGVLLFERDGRGVQPTRYAEGLRDYANSASFGLAQAMADIQALKSGTEGIVSLAGPQAIAEQLFGACAARIVRARPKLQLRITITSTELFSGLVAGQYDLVVAALYEEATEAGLARRLLFDDRFVAIVRPGHKLLALPHPEPRDLASQPWIFGPVGTLHRRRLEQFFNVAGLPLPRAAIECRSTEVIKSIVMATDHLALMSRMGAAAEISDGRLQAIELDSPFLTRPIGILWRQDRLTPPIEFAMAVIEEVCGESGLFASGRSASEG